MIQYTIVKQNRKTFSIAIGDKQEVLVKVPYGASKKQIDAIIKQNEAWILEMQAKGKLRAETKDWFVTKKQLFLGKYWNVKINQIYGTTHQIIFNQNLGFVLTTDGTEACARKLMEKFYRLKAKEILEPMATLYAQRIGVTYKKLTIRNQATRWGSCSSSGNLSFNMKILCAPLEMIEYVVLHELVHRRYFNHSSTFWKEVEKWMPDYKIKMNYFKEVGQDFII